MNVPGQEVTMWQNLFVCQTCKIIQQIILSIGTLSSGKSFRLHVFKTVKPASNTLSGQIGISNVIITLYLMLPYVPSNEDGKLTGNSHENP